MNHWKNIHERLKVIKEKADQEAQYSDLGFIVRDLADELTLMARLMAERDLGPEFDSPNNPIRKLTKP